MIPYSYETPHHLGPLLPADLFWRAAEHVRAEIERIQELGVAEANAENYPGSEMTLAEFRGHLPRA